MSRKPALFAHTRRSAICAVLVAAMATPLLGGCFIAGAAALTTGSLAATDRRTLGTQVEDRGIQLKAQSAIRERFGNTVHVNVTSYNRQVLLTGQAPDETTRAQIDGTVANVENVRLMVNDIQIAGNSSFQSRSNDAVITTRVKASLVNAQDLFANAFKISTEAGVVYIMGMVTEREADRAAAIASGVPGVVRVVKVVETISEAELNRMKVTPSNGTDKPPM